MRISTKIAVALAGSILLFAAFLGLSRYVMGEVQEHEQRLSRLNVVSREISNVLIGNRIYQDRLSGASYVTDSLTAAEQELESLLADADPVEAVFVKNMLERIEEFSDVFSHLVASKRFLARLDQWVREDVVRFGSMHVEMQQRLRDLRAELAAEGAADTDGANDLIRELIMVNAQLWGWVNRAISIIDRNLLLQNDQQRFQANFKIAQMAYERAITDLQQLLDNVGLDGVEAYQVMLEEVRLGLGSVSDEFVVAAKADQEAVDLLESHGARLREMVDRLIERGQEQSRRHSEDLVLIYWFSAVTLLAGAVALSIWFSVSIGRPINQLRKSFNAVASGNFNFQVPATGRSELDELARAFNEMTERLRSSYAEVEEKVRTRTKELKIATVRSRQLADAAQAANMAKSSFLATMSHEIRTPLNSIIGFSEMLAEGDLEEEQRADLESIRSSGNILLELINDILDLSKIEAGKVFLELGAVDLGEVVQEATCLFGMEAEKKGVALNVSVDASIPDAIWSDRTRIRQVLNNLIGNAIKFTANGAVDVHVWSEADPGDTSRRRYYISVRDSGIGIPEDKLEDVFLAFTQADSSTTREYGGTGLGLAISRRIVEMLGGEITLESQLGEGATFTLYIVDLDASAADSEVAGDGSLEKNELFFDKLPEILIVEDDPSNYKLTSKIIERLGLTAKWAKNGREAVEMVEAERFDVIFMDLQMPELDGIAATYEIRDMLPLKEQPYIIALTANALGESRESCEDAGMNDFLTKPVVAADIRIALLRFQQTNGEFPSGQS